MKNKLKFILISILYWLVQLTWGSILTIIGLCVALFTMIFLKGKPYRNGCSLLIKMHGNWGGACIGAIALVCDYDNETTNYYNKEYYEHCLKHEFGHSLQQLIFGPFQIFLVAIPSSIRYLYFNYCVKKHKPTKPYDSIWFEHTATKYGSNYLSKINNLLK